MKPVRTVVALTCLLAAVPVVAQSPMRAGQWEITSQMDMPGMPVKMPEQKTTTCVTPEQVSAPASMLPSQDKSCKASDYKVEGNKVTWKMTCSGRDKMTGDGEMVFSGDSYTGKMNMTMAQGSMSMKYTGKRIGDCTK
jgi:hypothetical protein